MERPRAPKKLDADGLWEYALRVLARRSQSSAELKQKLSLRAASPAVVTAVLAKLRDYGMADDAKFAESFASSRLRNQGFGKMRVLRDLQSKRVGQAIAQRAVEKTFEGTEELDLARQFLERKYRGRSVAELLKDERNMAAAYRRLRTAGFSGSVSLSVLKSYGVSAPADFEEAPEEE